MQRKLNVLTVIMSILWVSVVFHILMLELLKVPQSDLVLSGIITIALILISYTYYFVLYFKGKKSVQALKKQYLDSFKPKSPIRFAPSDEELMDKYLQEEKEMKSRAYIVKEKTPQENQGEEELENV